MLYFAAWWVLVFRGFSADLTLVVCVCDVGVAFPRVDFVGYVLRFLWFSVDMVWFRLLWHTLLGCWLLHLVVANLDVLCGWVSVLKCWLCLLVL